MAKDLAIRLCGERMRLLPERAILWEERATLIVADVHVGKAASFREFAIPTPGGTTESDLARLTRAVERTEAHRLMILGDLLHARAGRTSKISKQVHAWRKTHAGLEILHVRGNHDRGAGDPPAEWRIRSLEEPLPEGPFLFRHEPPVAPEGYSLAGHVHPAVRLRGEGGQKERLPCFLLGRRVGLLPAFGSFTGSATVIPAEGDRVYVVADEEIIEVKGRRGIKDHPLGSSG
jgi:DNA ligase-associated metallophosphoesterase